MVRKMLVHHIADQRFGLVVNLAGNVARLFLRDDHFGQARAGGQQMRACRISCLLGHFRGFAEVDHRRDRLNTP